MQDMMANIARNKHILIIFETPQCDAHAFVSTGALKSNCFEAVCSFDASDSLPGFGLSLAPTIIIGITHDESRVMEDHQEAKFPTESPVKTKASLKNVDGFTTIVF